MLKSLNRKTVLNVIAVTAAVFLLSSCTRPEADKSKIEISVPKTLLSNKNGAFSTNDLVHVVINVSGDGITSPIVYNWDSCRDCNAGTVAVPTSFSLDVPMGNNRLVQVLAVYGDSSNQSMNFYYGDVTKNLVSTNEAVNITVASVGTGAVVGGAVSGRYFSSTVSGLPIGPSGEVYVKYKPATKPAIIIEKGMIINGWFDVMGLFGAGLQMQYELASGEILFGGPVVLDESPLFDPSVNTSIVKMALPVHQRQDGGNSTFRPSESEKLVYGYWSAANSGVALTPYKVCRDLSGALASRFTFNNTSVGLTISAVSGSFPSNEDLSNTSSPLTSAKYKGGSLLSNNDCGGTTITAAGEYESYLKILSAGFNNGRDSIAGYRIPFRLPGSNGSPFTVTEVAGQKMIAGRALPGVNLAFDQIVFYKRLSPAGEGDYYLDNPSCTALPSDYSHAGTGAIDSQGNFSVITNITSAQAMAGVSAIACGSRAGKLSSVGFFVEKWNFSNGGNGVMPTPATNWELLTVPFGISLNACLPARVQLKSATNDHNVTNDVVRSFPVTLNVSAGTAALFSDSECTTSFGSGLTATVAVGAAASPNFYYKVTSGGATSVTISATSSGFGAANGSFNKMLSSAQTILNFVSDVGDTLHLGNSSNECREIDVYFVDQNNRVSSTTYSGPVGWTLNLGLRDVNAVPISTGIASIVDNCTAKNEISSISVVSGSFKTRFGLHKKSAAFTDAKITLDAPAALPGVAAISTPIYVSPSVVGHHLSMSIPVAPTIVGTCYEVQVGLRDASNVLIPVPANKFAKIAVSSAINGSQFYENSSDCEAAVNSKGNFYSGVILQGTSSRSLYLRANSGGMAGVISLSPSFSVSDNNANIGAVSSNYVLNPAIVITASQPTFGNVIIGGSAGAITLTVQNTTTRTLLSLNGAMMGGTVISLSGGAFPGTGGTCGATLAPGSSCTVVTNFNPVSAGTASDSINIYFDIGAGSGPDSVNFPLSGNGAP